MPPRCAVELEIEAIHERNLAFVKTFGGKYDNVILSPLFENSLDLEQTFKTMLSNLNIHLQFVSIGSGDGLIEILFMEYARRYGFHIKIWCVDPNPSSWSANKPFLKPDYSYCNELVEAIPQIRGNCTLFLHCVDPRGSPYDLSATLMLEPPVIFFIGDTKGSCFVAGHPLFKQWMDCPTTPYRMTDYYSNDPGLHNEASRVVFTRSTPIEKSEVFNAFAKFYDGTESLDDEEYNPSSQVPVL
jgi:hypothetical protein